MMNSVRDNLLSNDKTAVITSGSFGEGLDLRGSDVDILLVPKFIDLSEETKFDFNLFESYFTIEMEGIHPGYTRLRLVYSNTLLIVMCEEVNGKFFLSNALFKQIILSLQINASIIHGPCFTSELYYFDYAICLRSKSWITTAENWITRSSNLWPSNDVKESIVNHGALFVPIGFKGSTKEELEWRISFNVGERLLIYSFTHTQLVCYCLMKILLKDVINVGLEAKYRELLCSYFLKTIVFWISEELPPSVWRAENLLPCFMRCFRRLIYCVEYSVCPHYFIPQNNLFEYTIVGHAREELLNNLLMLKRCGWQCLLFSGKVFNRPNLRIRDTPYMSILDILKFRSSKLSDTDYSLIESVSCVYSDMSQTKGIQQILLNESSKIKYAYKYYMSMICSQNSQLIPLSDAFGNKYFYMNYKVCNCYLLQNIYHDDVSGWLMLATFFYRSKQYYNAIYILSNYVYIKLYPTKDMLNTILQLYSVKSYQIDFFPLYKIVHWAFVTFHRNSTLIPFELQMEVEKIPIEFTATTYTHFLHFLCHYHLNHLRECRDSLRDLQKTITTSYCIPDLTSKALSLICLGIAFQLHGDNDSAKKAFLLAYELETRGVKEAALKRLRWLELLQN